MHDCIPTTIPTTIPATIATTFPAANPTFVPNTIPFPQISGFRCRYRLSIERSLAQIHCPKSECRWFKAHHNSKACCVQSSVHNVCKAIQSK